MSSGYDAAPDRYGRPVLLDEALHIADAARAEAASRNWRMVIAIVDSGGALVLLHRMDQAQLGCIALAQRKAETAVFFRQATGAFQDALAEGGMHWRLLAPTGVLPVGGGFPLVSDGAVIGAIGVSGGLSSEDEQVALAGAASLARLA